MIEIEVAITQKRYWAIQSIESSQIDLNVLGFEDGKNRLEVISGILDFSTLALSKFSSL